MTPTIPDLLKALDDLEFVLHKIFEDIAPVYDEDERMMRRAMAVLHAYIKEINQP